MVPTCPGRSGFNWGPPNPDCRYDVVDEATSDVDVDVDVDEEVLAMEVIMSVIEEDILLIV